MKRSRVSSFGTVLTLVAAGVAAGVGAVSLTGCSGSGAVPHPMSGAGTAGTGGDTSGAAGATGTGGAAGATGSGAGTSGGQAASVGSTGTGGASTGGTTGAGGAGAGGTTGTGGAAAGGTTGTPSGPSAGCKASPPEDGIQKAVEHDLTVTVAPAYQAAYSSRKYFTTLPMSWDPTKPYPIIFFGQGCGATAHEGSPFTTGHFLTDVLYVDLIPATVTGATVVPSNGSPGCFQAGKQGGADSPDGPYFDQVLAEIEAKYCVDTGKVFVAGTSSGAWLSNYLACARGNVIRGAAADSGGLQQAHPTCTGGAAVMEMPGDSTSSIVDGVDIGVGPARDTFIMTNGCSMTSTDMKFGNATCQVYGGCSSPVAWCNVGGGHQSGLCCIGDSAWAFWATLMP